MCPVRAPLSHESPCAWRRWGGGALRESPLILPRWKWIAPYRWHRPGNMDCSIDHLEGERRLVDRCIPSVMRKCSLLRRDAPIQCNSNRVDKHRCWPHVQLLHLDMGLGKCRPVCLADRSTLPCHQDRRAPIEIQRKMHSAHRNRIHENLSMWSLPLLRRLRPWLVLQCATHLPNEGISCNASNGMQRKHFCILRSRDEYCRDERENQKWFKKIKWIQITRLPVWWATGRTWHDQMIRSSLYGSMAVELDGLQRPKLGPTVPRPIPVHQHLP